jgi:cholesterol transport system auxiliary component
MKTLVVATLAAALAACSGLRPTEARHYFVLEAPSPTASAPQASPKEGMLLIGIPTVAEFYDSQAMVFSRTAGQLSHYQHSSWAEPPGRRLTMLLLAELDARAVFRQVAVAGSGVRGRVLLATHLQEIYHDVSSTPGVARVAVVAEVIDLPRHALIARRTFSAAEPVATHDAAGAAQGCGRALGTVVAEVAEWVAEVAPSGR